MNKDNTSENIVDKKLNSLKWIGEDVNEWSQGIRNGYARAYIIFSLLDTGVFDALKGHKKTSSQLANECNLNSYLLDGVLNYLTYADVVLEKEHDSYFFTEKGLEYIFSDKIATISYGAVGGYSCLFTNLTASLKNEVKYGDDFIRQGDFVAISSQVTGGGNYKWITDKLSELGVETVLDLGCGTAGVLTEYCRINPNINGIGVDISEGAINEATKIVAENNLSDRIKLVVGDITKPETYESQAGKFQAINGVMVFHEFLREGEDYMVNLLKDMKSKFPGTYLFLGEVDIYSDAEIRALDIPDRTHFLFYQYVIHALTWQGMPMHKEKWIDIMERAGLEIVEVKEDLPSLLRIVEIVAKF
jgi:2-ketoarginine methyltransferase